MYRRASGVRKAEILDHVVYGEGLNPSEKRTECRKMQIGEKENDGEGEAQKVEKNVSGLLNEREGASDLKVGCYVVQERLGPHAYRAPRRRARRKPINCARPFGAKQKRKLSIFLHVPVLRQFARGEAWRGVSGNIANDA